MNSRLTAIIYFYIILSAIIFGCNDAVSIVKKPAEDNITTVEPAKEDTVITRLRPVLFDLQNAELSFNGHKPFDLTISNIRYNLISLKEYYTEQQASLQVQAKYSTNREKTEKALNYLTNMIKESSNSTDLYKVTFHLKAQVDKTNYDTEKILYLKNDLTLLQLIFPQ